MNQLSQQQSQSSIAREPTPQQVAQIQETRMILNLEKQSKYAYIRLEKFKGRYDDNDYQPAYRYHNMKHAMKQRANEISKERLLHNKQTNYNKQG